MILDYLDEFIGRAARFLFSLRFEIYFFVAITLIAVWGHNGKDDHKEIIATIESNGCSTSTHTLRQTEVRHNYNYENL